MKKIFRYSVLLVLTLTTVNFLFIFFLNLIAKIYHFNLFYSGLMLALACFLAATVLTIIIICTMPVLREFLNTSRQKTKLENLSHPLMMRLAKEASGTYHHSLTVANLANKAAKAIEADSILCRVGGYYHDIGKLKNPHYFMENQKAQLAIKDRQLSKIIINHVKDGVALAKEYNLPREIIDLILQHHGTMALQSLDFKNKMIYPGPKPLTKEAGILMLADAVEAQIRTVSKPRNSDIIHILEKTIQERVNSKQLEFCGLTNRDLKRIQEAFLEMLLAMYHQRLAYPKP
ncbi:MAG: hypothetical protein COX39_02660 [Candidatus Nealsonbacteria bacterium CG23_combo_of_CG06-09_8_20_14_all_40_13]|uniref:HD domain-containing protein n=1 Tax=Candidatus Nealsonbacteria bacterium CG23_combo_of_CG06-09_8_20_14_all_40_13 TaxID=1974724 RepID=A0A2G9YQI5_9BACT|nr:MAG: hypothetical protein COX39_02660 [Candidatus Nealsonbacteria bacterium CG23_combo_of_CG06-09_8_20_14_all_40_13]PIR71326.1 MAG: hypothetical protein COU44_00105 [Candidatus Nealsonbacteria bacterium CG10_big_fil_rev_8_21_14_0_10_40_24]PIU43029.1 MAG: hypothetical protein COS97_03305 [Candidatus Nealsonbacteria bacterium CG07_land_8_20_14_0_80_40_10]